MKIVLLIYVIGIIPAFLSLRHSFIRLSGKEGRTSADAMLMVICSLFSWITFVVTSTIMSLLFIEDIDQKPVAGADNFRVRRH